LLAPTIWVSLVLFLLATALMCLFLWGEELVPGYQVLLEAVSVVPEHPGGSDAETRSGEKEENGENFL
jgi:hypothetical protein